jgi:hypothetical protein
VACDQGHQDDRPATTGSPVHVVNANVGLGTPLPTTHADGSPSTIELAFDQLLSPASITRQTFILTDLTAPPNGPNDLTPSLSYDPVARVVSLTPLSPLTPNLTYRLTITTPSGPGDPNGLRSVGGTTLDATSPITLPITFTAVAGTQPAIAHSVDFCSDIMPIFLQKCGTSGCHSGPLPAEGLGLDSFAAVQLTIKRTAQTANMGTSAYPPSVPGCGASTCPPFGVDMPIIDPGTSARSSGDPGNSWLLYKLLLALPSPCPDIDKGNADGGDAGDDASADAGDGAADDGECEAGTAGVLPGPPTYHLAWQDLTPGARGTLANLVAGAPMPYPADEPTGLALQDLETLSFWIAAGAPMFSCPTP